MVTVNLFSEKEGEVNKFLSHFYNTNLDIENSLKWEKESTARYNYDNLKI